MGNSPGFSFLLSETPPAVRPEPVQSEAPDAPNPRRSDAAPAVRKVQFPTRLAQSVSARPPSAHLDDDPLDEDVPGAPPFTGSDAPPEDLPIHRQPEQPPSGGLGSLGVGSLSAALLSRLRRASEAPEPASEPAHPERPISEPRERAAEHQRPLGSLPFAPSAERTSQGSPSPTGGTFARALWGKARSPLAALLAFGVFYVGGTELIGRTQIALSKPSVPDVPELGTLETKKDDSNAGSKARRRTSGADEPATDAETAGVTTEPASRERAPLATELVDLPPGLSWPGKGLVEVVTPEDELIYVDGVFIGRGPLRRIPLSPGEHEVWIQKDAVRQAGKVQVVLDRSVRAVFAFR